MKSLSFICVAVLVAGSLSFSVADAPDDTPCMSWVPLTADTPITNVDQYAGTASTWVIGSGDCSVCDVWGTVLPCFATDYGLDLFGHRDFNKDWIPEDWCRVALPKSDNGGTYFSTGMMLPKKGKDWSSTTWQTVSLGDVVPLNVVRYGTRVLARTVTSPQDCCAGQGFSGWAQISSNMTLTSVHIAVYSSQHELSSFQVAICSAYHPVTPAPTPVPPVPPPPTPAPTPQPVPTLPPTPVPPPPTTAAPTPSPNAPWNIVTRTSCLIGCNYNCTTFLYMNNQCSNQLRGTSTSYSCGSGKLNIADYSTLGCTGQATKTENQTVNKCVQLPDMQYVTDVCETVNAPVNAGLNVVSRTCVEGCDYECKNSSQIAAGSCVIEHPQYGTGGPTVYNCFDSFIARTTYFASQCSDVTSNSLSVTTVHPRNKCLPTGHNDAYITYYCN